MIQMVVIGWERNIMKRLLMFIAILSGLALANPVLADTNLKGVRDITTVAKTSVAGASGLPITGVKLVGEAVANQMNEHLYSNCEQQNKQACDKAQYGTHLGATAGTAAAAGVLTIVGTGPVGLATIGATVGGGIAAGALVGTAAVVAAPVVAAAAVGGLVYWLFK
jgi:hypothetical protein